MPSFEQSHSRVAPRLRGLLLVLAFVAIGLILDRAGVHSNVARPLLLAVMLSVMATWASWEKKRHDRFQR